MKFQYLLLLFFFSLAALTIKGQDTLAITAEQLPLIETASYRYILEDSTASLDFASVRAAFIREATANGLEFLPADELEASFGSSQYWVAAYLQLSDSLPPLHFVPESPGWDGHGFSRNNKLNAVQIFSREGDLIFSHEADQNQSGTLADHSFAWPDLPNETVLLIWRINKSDFPAPLILGFSLQTNAHFEVSMRQRSSYFHHSFILGLLIMAIFYHLLLFVYTRDSAYGWFAAWIVPAIFATCYQHPDSPIIGSWFGNSPELLIYGWILTTKCVWIFFWQFGRQFMQLPTKYPRLDKLIKLYIAIAVLHLLISLWMGAPFRFNGQFEALLYIGLVLFSLGLSLRLLFLKDRFCVYFGAGALAGGLALALGVFWSTGLIQLPFDPYATGNLSQLAIFSVGLAFRESWKLQQQLATEKIAALDGVKNRFFANVSHEFRTPLSLIAGPVNQALDQAEEEINSQDSPISLPRQQLQLIARNTHRLENLVDQLLDLSQLQHGKMDLKVRPGDVFHVIRAIAASFEGMAASKQQNYHWDIPRSSTERYYFDADKLEKIIANLLANAMKYTPKNGQVSIAATLQNQELAITVSDTGPGISKEAQTHIFDRFYRVAGTDETVGTGLGLSLVQELVAVYRGRINIDSAPGAGSSFKVFLPVQQTSFSGEEIILSHNMEVFIPSIQAGSAHTTTQTTTQTTKGLQAQAEDEISVLIIEDHPDLLDFIATALPSAYCVLKASNGRKGLDLARQYIPDLIISDLMMPELDGLAVCRAIREDQKTSHIPLIFLTAKVSEKDKLAGLKLGADDYLTKPFSSKELLVRVDNLIEQRTRLRQSFATQLVFGPEEVVLESREAGFLKTVRACIENRMSDEQFSVTDLAAELGFSRSQLHRKLKALTDQSPNQLIRSFRLERAQQLLTVGTASVSEIAYAVGYANLSYFSKTFKEAYGKLPSETAKNK